MLEIILASASPRRKELLKQIGIKFHTKSSDIDEIFDESLSPDEIVKKLSYDKAQSVARELMTKGKDSCLVIGADTVVSGEKLLGKPKDREDAYVMLKSLSGKWHEVLTGITLVQTDTGKFISSFEKTRVKMKKLEDTEIQAYIDTGEPFDKAGAYGIQGIGAVLVEKIDGCYFNVVGLPVYKLTEMLKDFGIRIL